MVAWHFVRQLQLLTVNKGAEEVVEAAEEVLVKVEEMLVKVEEVLVKVEEMLVKVEEMLGLASGCSCSQIDPFAFLSLIGLTVLLAWLGFTTCGALKTGATLVFCGLLVRIGLLQCAVSLRGLPILPLLLFETSPLPLLPDPGVLGVEAFSFLMLKSDFGVCGFFAFPFPEVFS